MHQKTNVTGLIGRNTFINVQCRICCCLIFFIPLENLFTRLETLWRPRNDCKFLIYPYTRHWSLSSECSLLNYTVCDTGHPFIKVIWEDLWHSHLLPCVGSANVTICLNDDQVYRNQGSNTNPSEKHGLSLWCLGWNKVFPPTKNKNNR